jgi:hypothetical protein
MTTKLLPIGTSDFKTVIENEYTYLDRTLLVKEIFELGDRVVLFPRPRRFGKTLNLSMLRYFLEKSDQNTSRLFEHLAIWKYPEYREKQGKYPVIFLTFKDNKHSTWEATFAHFRLLLGEELARHSYLLDSSLLSLKEKEDFNKLLHEEADQTLYENSLRFLTKWLYLYHGTKPVVLIDEYDTPVHSAYTGNFYPPMMEFLRNLLSGCLKDNSNLERGILTGILRIAKESIFSGMNNVSTFSVLQTEFQDKFGLLESEVKELLTTYGLQEHHALVTQWYNGYCMGSCPQIYNPWSVLNFIARNGNLLPYWVNSSDNALMQQCISHGSGELKAEVEDLLKGNAIEKKLEEGFIFTDFENKPNAIWTLLLYSGYLTLEGAPQGPLSRLRIPNAEVRELYNSTILGWFERGLSERKYRLLLDALTSGDIETFSLLFKEYVQSSVSIFDVSGIEPEKTYHAFVLGMLVGLKDRYEVKSNRESGLGRYDVMLIPKNREALGIIIEFKKISAFKKVRLDIAALAALQQIESKQYAQELVDRGIKAILNLAIVFEDKEVEILHKFT